VRGGGAWWRDVREAAAGEAVAPLDPPGAVGG
jgi:hypothetical protein